MQIQLCRDKSKWEKWLTSLESKEFLQSWEWGEFQASTGKEVVRLQIVKGEEILGQFQGFVLRPIPMVPYLYVPRPDAKTNLALALAWKSLIVPYLKKKQIVFVRLEPAERLPKQAELNAVPTKNVQAHTTLLLDIMQSEEDLLKQMHSKTRYNIRLAERKGVKVKQEKNIDVYWNLAQETRARDKFSTHAKSYYEKMLQSDQAIQLTAYYNGESLVSNICINNGQTFTYLHGASSNKHRNIMVPYLLQWEAITLAKKLGCKFYDFWGVAPIVEEEANVKKTCFNNFCWQVDHKYTGFTRFKVGFSGIYKAYPEAVDLILKKLVYNVYKVGRKLL